MDALPAAHSGSSAVLKPVDHYTDYLMSVSFLASVNSPTINLP